MDALCFTIIALDVGPARAFVRTNSKERLLDISIAVLAIFPIIIAALSSGGTHKN